MFENFRGNYTQITPKSTFYCFLLRNFPKIYKKSAQKFFAAPSAPKVWRNTPIFSARLWKNHPPPFEGSPPKISLFSTCLYKSFMFMYPRTDVHVGFSPKYMYLTHEIWNFHLRNVSYNAFHYFGDYFLSKLAHFGFKNSFFAMNHRFVHAAFSMFMYPRYMG